MKESEENMEAIIKQKKSIEMKVNSVALILEICLRRVEAR